MASAMLRILAPASLQENHVELEFDDVAELLNDGNEDVGWQRTVRPPHGHVQKRLESLDHTQPLQHVALQTILVDELFDERRNVVAEGRDVVARQLVYIRQRSSLAAVEVHHPQPEQESPKEAV